MDEKPQQQQVWHMSGRVGAAFCFGALSYHVLQSVAFGLLEVPEGFNLSVKTGPAGQKSLSLAAYMADINEERMTLRGGEPDRSTATVGASKNLEIEEMHSHEISIAETSDDSGVFRSSTDVPPNHIGVASLVESANSENLITTHLNPADVLLPAHIGPSTPYIDRTLGHDTKILHIGERLQTNTATPK